MFEVPGLAPKKPANVFDVEETDGFPVLPPSYFVEGWCVYEIRLITPADPPLTIYRGVCPLRNALATPDARSIDEFNEYITSDEIMLRVIVTAVGKNEIDCRNRRAIDFQKFGMPHFNGIAAARRGQMRTSARRVTCLDTGEVFNSASDCAKAHDLSPSQLSRHLQGATGYKAVKGRCYSWV